LLRRSTTPALFPYTTLFRSNQPAKSAISPRRDEDFPEWYQQVIRAAELAEPSDVRGCMVIRPWGFGIWENMQHQLDAMIRATGQDRKSTRLNSSHQIISYAV